MYNINHQVLSISIKGVNDDNWIKTIQYQIIVPRHRCLKVNVEEENFEVNLGHKDTEKYYKSSYMNRKQSFITPNQTSEEILDQADIVFCCKTTNESHPFRHFHQSPNMPYFPWTKHQQVSVHNNLCIKINARTQGKQVNYQYTKARHIYFEDFKLQHYL